MGDARILSGIVIYHPPPQAATLIADLIAQNCDVCVTINACDSADDIAFFKQRSVICTINSENKGLAQALNTIIINFLASEYTHLFLFDQDSILGPDFISTMLQELDSQACRDVKIACMAPRIVDIRLGHFKHTKHLASRSGNRTTLAITSGCLFTKDSLQRVGLMDESLFIDAVDHEWCLRAQAMGFDICFSQNAILQHTIGDRAIVLGPVRKPMHSNPERHYYIIRNSLYLLRKSYIPWRWKLLEIMKTIRRAVAYPLLSHSPVLSLQMVALGIGHGLTGRMGKLGRLSR